jgi:putative aldouronate transport system substrate-binding protein
MKRISTRRIVALLLVAMLGIAAVMTGCGQAQQTATEATTASTETTATEATTAAPLPPATVTWYNVRTPQTDTQMVVDKVNQMLAEKTKLNITLDFKLVDWGSYADKMAVMVQSGEPLDLMYAASWINYFSPLATKGGLYPMDDLLTQHGQDILRQVDPNWLTCEKVNGKIYGIPNVQGFAQRKGLTFNAALVDKYHFDYKSVKTLLDVEPFLKTIKENEPGITPFLPGTGVADMFLPGDKPMQGIGNLISYDPATKSLVNDLENQQNKDYYAKMHEWYKLGYIAKDAASKVTWGDEIRTQTYAVMPNFGYQNDGIKSSADYGFKCYDILTYIPSPISTNMVTVGQTVISSTSTQPDRAMQLLNAVWADKEIYNTLCFGIEGTHWNFKDKATELIEFTDKAAGYAEYNNYQIGSIMNLYGRDGQTQADMKAELATNTSVPVSELLGFTYTPDALKNENAAVSAIWEEVQYLLGTGTYDPAVKMPKILDRVKAAGWDALRDDCQKQIDNWKAVNSK